MVELNKLRQEIDDFDTKLLRILKKRFEVCRKIADYKKKHNLPVYDATREKQIIKSKISKARLNPKFIKRLFKIILKESKRQMRGKSK